MSFTTAAFAGMALVLLFGLAVLAWALASQHRQHPKDRKQPH